MVTTEEVITINPPKPSQKQRNLIFEAMATAHMLGLPGPYYDDEFFEWFQNAVDVLDQFAIYGDPNWFTERESKIDELITAFVALIRFVRGPEPITDPYTKMHFLEQYKSWVVRQDWNGDTRRDGAEESV